MELLYLVGTIWSVLLITFAMLLDTRRPMSTKLKYKYRVKDNSILRKIIKFKDKEDYPCNYFKIVPVYVFISLAFSSLVLLLVNAVSNNFIADNVPNELFIIVALCIIAISVIYYTLIIVWWEIVDYKEFKLNEEERELLKQLRKSRKENDK